MAKLSFLQAVELDTSYNRASQRLYMIHIEHYIYRQIFTQYRRRDDLILLEEIVTYYWFNDHRVDDSEYTKVIVDGKKWTEQSFFLI
jgi:hypothetical protein